MAILYTNAKKSTFSQDAQITTYKWYPILIPVILAVITFVTYLPSLWYDFHFDDKENILKFFAIRHATFKELCFSSPRWISKWLNTLYYAIDGFNPFVYRFAGVLFHITTGIILFSLMYRILQHQSQNNLLRRFALVSATITSALFLLHPLQTQTVSYIIQGQLEGLSALATLTLLLIFYGYTQSKTKAQSIWYFIALIICTLLGCGTKEIFIIVPFLLVSMDWFFIAQGELKKCVSRLWLYAILSAIIFSSFYYFSTLKVFTLANQAYNNFGNTITADGGTIISRYAFFISQFKVILHYIQICFWPYGISVDYDWKMVSGFLAHDCIVPFIVLVAIGTSIFLLLIKNKQSLFAFSFLWFFIAIMPRASIIPACELVADYKTYLSSIGIFFMLSLCVIELIELTKQHFHYYLPFFIALTSSALLIISYATYSRNLVWSDEKAFWLDIIEKAPLKARGHNNYGTALQDAGEYEQSLIHFKRAIEIDAKYPDPWINSSISYNKLHAIDDAINCIEKALEISNQQPEAYLNYGLFLHAKKQYIDAKIAFKHAIALRSYYGKAWHNLALVEAEMGNYLLAIEAAKFACTKSDYITQNSFLIWARSAIALEDYDSAIDAYKSLLEINPHSIDATVQLAQCYIFKKEYVRSFELYTQIVQTITDNPFIWCNLGECALHLEKYDEAITGFTNTIHLMPSMTQAMLKLAHCYEITGKPEEALELCKKIIADYPPAKIMAQAKQLMQKLQAHNAQI